MKMIDHNHFICHLILGTFTEYPFISSSFLSGRNPSNVTGIIICTFAIPLLVKNKSMKPMLFRTEVLVKPIVKTHMGSRYTI